MAFYSKTNEVFDGQGFTYYNEGSHATVYRLNDVLFKKYSIDCNFRFRLQKKMFEFLKKLNVPNLVELYDYYFMCQSALIKLISIDAYTMKLVSGEKINLINCDRKFLIHILKELEETLKILCDNKIVLYDVHPKNVILTDDGITIIDPDLFYLSPLSSKRQIYKLNKKELLNCINNILVTEFNEEYGDSIVPLVTCTDDTSLENDVINSLTEDTFRDSILQHTCKFK